MQAKSEFYKGIEFIRITALPTDQKETFLASLNPDKVIKILKDDVVLSDCILYSDYLNWFNAYHPVPQIANRDQPAAAVMDFLLSKN